MLFLVFCVEFSFFCMLKLGNYGGWLMFYSDLNDCFIWSVWL